VVSASQNGPAVKIGYSLWMFSMVLLLDILIADAKGNTRAISQFLKTLPWLDRVSGEVLILLVMGVWPAWSASLAINQVFQTA